MSRRTHPPIRPAHAAMLVAAALFGPAVPVRADAGTFSLARGTIDSGGGTSSGGGFTLRGTVGQAEGGPTMSGGGLALAGGFWAPVQPACAGDTNGSGDVDVDDLVNVILDWGTNGAAHGGDVTDASGEGPPDGIVNVNDLNAVIVNWGLCP